MQAIDPREMSQTAPRPTHRRLVRRLSLIALGMFGFGFALVPLYGVFCELTGLQGRGVRVETKAPDPTGSDREVRVRFLATTHSGLPWVFQAGEKTRAVRLGELAATHYRAMNTRDEAIAGRATFNVVPPEASLYFVKTECFCFTRQLLQARETREMPVYFYIQPDLPERIREITLAYTFFRAEDEADATVLAQAAATSFE